MQNEISFFPQWNYLLPLIQTRVVTEWGCAHLPKLHFEPWMWNWNFTWGNMPLPKDLMPLEEMMDQKKYFQFLTVLFLQCKGTSHMGWGDKGTKPQTQLIFSPSTESWEKRLMVLKISLQPSQELCSPRDDKSLSLKGTLTPASLQRELSEQIKGRGICGDINLNKVGLCRHNSHSWEIPSAPVPSAEVPVQAQDWPQDRSEFIRNEEFGQGVAAPCPKALEAGGKYFSRIMDYKLQDWFEQKINAQNR